jgi:transcriptional regulator with XRE-family HTH domain
VVNNIQLIKRRMQELELDDTKLAEISGIHITLIRRYLKKETRIGAENAPRLARALELSVGAVLCGEQAA